MVLLEIGGSHGETLQIHSGARKIDRYNQRDSPAASRHDKRSCSPSSR